MKKKTIIIADETQLRLSKFCDEQGYRVNFIVDRAVKEMLSEMKKKMKLIATQAENDS